MSESETTTGPGLLISDAAWLSGLTPRAVRYYESIGLLGEPDRDSAGYRRYSTADLVALVRISRLRALGMPVAQIAARVVPGAGPGLVEDLRALAAELTEEIARLSSLRDQVADMIDRQALEDPGRTLTLALRRFGRMASDAELDHVETDAVSLLDALHPAGVAGAVSAAEDILRDPGRTEAFTGLLQRYQALSEASTEDEVDALADEVVATLPRPAGAPRSVDLGAMEALLGERLNPAQRRFMRRLREGWKRADD